MAEVNTNTSLITPASLKPLVNTRTPNNCFVDLWNTLTGPPKPSLSDRLIVECNQLEIELQQLVEKIQFFHTYINARDELKKVCTQYFDEYITLVPLLPERSFKETELIQKRTFLVKQINNYKHNINEYKEFIARHHEVYLCFLKHLKGIKTPLLKFEG